LKLAFEQLLESLAVVFLVAVVAVEELEQVEDELEARNKKDRDFDY
jgi:hypothetical protein